MRPAHRITACALAIAALGPAAAAADDLPARGQVEIRSYAVPGSNTPRVVVRAVMELPPRKVWAVVSDCARYKERMPRIAASELVKQEGNRQTCRVTVEMPFPLANLTGVTTAVLQESAAGMSRRWTLVSGDFKANDGSWEVTPVGNGSSSLVVYTIHAEPTTSVPAWLRESAQRKALPELFERVKAEAAKLP